MFVNVPMQPAERRRWPPSFALAKRGQRNRAVSVPEHPYLQGLTGHPGSGMLACNTTAHEKAASSFSGDLA